ncbi:HEAT repeat domain-containing protein [Streptomyces sp. NBC_01207]|uniref:HEAT repeat domain-containing protein n=1 Tax=Streptomyces sp. NBC_01207 TaxID=2903772 RepID=UPI002E10ED84|nr:HEAT repeat domain-containing protein [Streptomyces sp. NBC_01207]
MGGDDPVLWVAAVYASANLDQDLPVRQLDRLVDVFSDLAVRPRFEEAWYQTDYEFPSSREEVLWWISRRLEHNFEAQLSFAVRLIEAAGRTGDTPLCRGALDLAWHQLVRRRSVATVLLPLAGALLDDPDGPIRLRAANILAAIGPTAAPYADRLAELLDDAEADEGLDGTVGEIARWALARTGDPRALPGLIEQLRAQGEESRGYNLEEPRRPHIAHVLIPLRANAHVLLPAMRWAIRDGGPQGDATHSFLAVLEAWGEDALPALPDLLPLLADTWTFVDVLGVLRAMGPAAASAEPALSTCQLLDHLGNHWSVTSTAACIRGDRAAALRLVGDAVMTAQVPEHGPFSSLAEFGRDAAPYAEWVRSIHESSTQWWARLSTAVTPWSITGQADPAVQVLEEYVLPVADGDDSFGSFREALRGLIRIGEISPVIRDALLTVRESERRLSQRDGYEAILQDEELRRLIEQVLACPHASPSETCRCSRRLDAEVRERGRGEDLAVEG